MLTVRAKVQLFGDVASVVPIVIPNRKEVREFAERLHAQGQSWKGEAFGWSAEHNPERPKPPLDSKMSFTPADFCIGESGIWFYSLIWEHGRKEPPVGFQDNRNLVPNQASL